jgi:hypothetical protein
MILFIPLFSELKNQKEKFETLGDALYGGFSILVCLVLVD